MRDPLFVVRYFCFRVQDSGFGVASFDSKTFDSKSAVRCTRDTNSNLAVYFELGSYFAASGTPNVIHGCSGSSFMAAAALQTAEDYVARAKRFVPAAAL